MALLIVRNDLRVYYNTEKEGSLYKGRHFDIGSLFCYRIRLYFEAQS